jgi:predicted kinase
MKVSESASKFFSLFKESMRLLESRVVTPEKTRGNVVILMGAPGSGKSMVTKFGLINLDNIRYLASDVWTELLAKSAGEDIRDPDVTAKYHDVTSEIHKRMVNKSITSGRDDANYMLEVTGKDLESLTRRIKSIAASGLRIILVHVRVPMRVAIAGNMSRARQVPKDMLMTAHENAIRNFELVLPMVDEGWIITNWTGSHYPSYEDFRSSELIQQVK